MSCFFVDTAADPLDYLAAIAGLLKVGGVLVNIGPLM